MADMSCADLVRACDAKGWIERGEWSHGLRSKGNRRRTRENVSASDLPRRRAALLSRPQACLESPVLDSLPRRSVSTQSLQRLDSPARASSSRDTEAELFRSMAAGDDNSLGRQRVRKAPPVALRTQHCFRQEAVVWSLSCEPSYEYGEACALLIVFGDAGPEVYGNWPRPIATLTLTWSMASGLDDDSHHDAAWVAFEALNAFTSLCDETAAITELQQLDEDVRIRALQLKDQRSGYTLLHLAAQFGLERLSRELLRCGAQLDATCRDLVLNNKIVQSGGRSALHLAAAHGEADVARLLVSFGADKSLRDWDTMSPGEAAAASGHVDLAALLGCVDDAPCQATHLKARLARQANLLRVPDHLRHAYAVHGVLSPDECDSVLAAVVSTAAASGTWCTSRHFEFATTDMAARDVPIVDKWIRTTLRRRLFPVLHERHGAVGLAYRDLFFVKYAHLEQNDLPLHRDATPLSFNVLLNSPHHFSGGGTFIEADDHTYCLDIGDALVHSGALRHAAARVTSGHRFVLVAFVHCEHIA